MFLCSDFALIVLGFCIFPFHNISWFWFVGWCWCSGDGYCCSSCLQCCCRSVCLSVCKYFKGNENVIVLISFCWFLRQFFSCRLPSYILPIPVFFFHKYIYTYILFDLVEFFHFVFFFDAHSYLSFAVHIAFSIFLWSCLVLCRRWYFFPSRCCFHSFSTVIKVKVDGLLHESTIKSTVSMFSAFQFDQKFLFGSSLYCYKENLRRMHKFDFERKEKKLKSQLKKLEQSNISLGKEFEKNLICPKFGCFYG